MPPVQKRTRKHQRKSPLRTKKYSLKPRAQNGAGLFSWMFGKNYKKEALYVTNRVLAGLHSVQRFDNKIQKKFKKWLYYVIKAQLTVDKYKNRYISAVSNSNNRSSQHIPYRKKLVDIFKNLQMKLVANGGYEPVINTKTIKKNEPPITNYINKFVTIIVAFCKKLEIDSIETVNEIPTPNPSKPNKPVYYVAIGAKVGKVYFFDTASYEAVDPVLFQLVRTDLGNISSSDKSEKKYRTKLMNTFISLYSSYAKALSNYINYQDLISQGNIKENTRHVYHNY